MNITELLKKHEGYRQFPYHCTAGKLTIGIGFNLDDVGLSEDESELILAHRIGKLKTKLAASLPFFPKLDEVRQACLLDMAYQMGVKGLLKFETTLALVQHQRYDNAAKHMLDSKWARQTPNRAQRIAEMMRTGQWPTS